MYYDEGLTLAHFLGFVWFFSRKTKCCDRFVFLYICLSGWWCGKRLIYWISILYLDTPYNPQTKGAFCLLFLLHIFLRNLFGRNISSFNIVCTHSVSIHLDTSNNQRTQQKKANLFLSRKTKTFYAVHQHH